MSRIQIYFLSLSEINDYIYKLIEDELSYEKDLITNEGWNIIENIIPTETIKYLHEYEDIAEITYDDINRAYMEVLTKFRPICGYRISSSQ